MATLLAQKTMARAQDARTRRRSCWSARSGRPSRSPWSPGWRMVPPCLCRREEPQLVGDDKTANRYRPGMSAARWSPELLSARLLGERQAKAARSSRTNLVVRTIWTGAQRLPETKGPAITEANGTTAYGKPPGGRSPGARATVAKVSDHGSEHAGLAGEVRRRNRHNPANQRRAGHAARTRRDRRARLRAACRADHLLAGRPGRPESPGRARRRPAARRGQRGERQLTPATGPRRCSCALAWCAYRCPRRRVLTLDQICRDLVPC